MRARETTLVTSLQIDSTKQVFDCYTLYTENKSIPCNLIPNIDKQMCEQMLEHVRKVPFCYSLIPSLYLTDDFGLNKRIIDAIVCYVLRKNALHLKLLNALFTTYIRLSFMLYKVKQIS